MIIKPTLIKLGYKHTEVGVIPNDWVVRKLDDISIVDPESLGGWTNPDYKFNYISLEDVDFGVLKNYSELFFRVAPSRARRVIQQKDILISTVRPNLKSHLYIKNPVKDFICSTGFAVLRCRHSEINAEYVFNQFFYSIINSQIETIITGSNYPGINSKEVRKLQIPMPPDENEQTAIASTLSDFDSLIASLQKQIDKKKNIKQGAMQELLTGKRRLPGFQSKWRRAIIKKLLQMPITDGPHLTPEFINDGVPFLSVNNIKDNKITLQDLRYISKKDDQIFSKKCKPQRYDILMGKAATVGTVAIVENSFDFNIWSPLALIRLERSYYPKFFYYLFQTDQISNQIKLLTNSSSQGNIGMGDIGKLEFIFPEFDEQKELSDLFSDMDCEIEHIESKLLKIQSLKQAAMQQLLTGKIRLI